MLLNAAGQCFLVLTALTVLNSPFAGASCSVQTHADGVHVDCSSRQWDPQSLRRLIVTSESRVVTLNLSHKEMTPILDLAGLPLSNLLSLDVSHSAIQLLPARGSFAYLTSLQTLNLNGNRLTAIQAETFSGLTSLRTLNLNGNRLTVIQAETFSGLTSLRTLNLNGNRLTAIRAETFSGLTSLRTLNLDGNRLTAIQTETFSGMTSLQTLNLDGNRLTAIQAETFSGLQHLQTLGLRMNLIRVLRNDSFSGMPALRDLSLEGNPMERIELCAFRGLGALANLNLRDHNLGSQNVSLPPGVFAPLVSLQQLFMDSQHDVPGDGYPDNVFGDLVSLEYLSLYSFPRVYFGPDFARLKSLSNLTLGLHGRCRIKCLHNDSFEGFHNSSSLTALFVTDCHGLMEVETCALCHLPSLKLLHLNHHGNLRATYAVRALYGLRNQPMDEVVMSELGVYLPYSTALDHNTAPYLPAMCIRSLDMRRTNLMRITARASYHNASGAVQLAACLQHVDLSDNRLAGDLAAIWILLTRFRQLRSLRMENQRRFSLVQSACVLSKSTNCHNRNHDSVQAFSTLYVPTPVHLSYLNMSALSGYYNQPPRYFNFTSAESLHTLDLGYGWMSPCLTTFLGLKVLTTLVLDGNYCYNISDTIFDHLPALRRLSLANLHLQAGILSQRLLRHVPLLETLNVSQNWLVEMQGRSLPHQPHLKQLTAAFNSFQGLPLDLDLHPNLTDLDLSYNSVTSLTSEERASLDSLAARHGLRLSLKGNPLLCACSNLDFVRWLWDTPIILDGQGISTRRYTCTAESGETTDTERVMMDMDFHWRQCIGPQAFGLALSGLFLQLLALVTVYLLWRSWTYVRYCWLAVKRVRLPRRQDFAKDVYVVYADADAELACLQLPRCLQPHGVRLLLRDLHDQPGSVRADSVVTNIENCWKVLLLVTGAFSRDEWSCGFSVHQAQRAVTDTRPDRVLVLFLEGPRGLQPMLSLDLLLRFLPESSVFHLHRDAPRDRRHPAWARLAETVLTSQLQ